MREESDAAEAFRLTDSLECDLIMKGGITSGIVYPYAVLELAAKYRFRSLGGTSAGAIAAAFAAAAEFSRSVRNDPQGFVRLKTWCDSLPDELLNLFQPDPGLERTAALIRQGAAPGGVRAIIKRAIGLALLGGLGCGAALGGALWFGTENGLAALIGSLLGLVAGAIITFGFVVHRTAISPLGDALHDLPKRMFGFCSGLTVRGQSTPALTDWLHQALQDIAWGSSDWPEVLTFGHLEHAKPGIAPIELRMVATNLSLMRPHTLPDFGMQAGFKPEEWRELFPPAVVDHCLTASQPWKGVQMLPDRDALPVVVATRMSLSFPLLFKAVPLHAEDYEYFRVVRGLGGTPQRRMRQMWISDGGISSNFPIHLFDSPLPSRPTFAVSLDELNDAPGDIQRRVLLPADTLTGLGIPIGEISSLTQFAWRVFYSAKDWQDQLLAGISGQRERIAHVYLGPGEGGLNLNMSADVSRRLMGYGLQAGRLFASGAFDFDEHRWRRTLAFYRNSSFWLERASATWNSGYQDWFKAYAPEAKSYRLSSVSRNRLGNAVDVMLVPPPPEQRLSPATIRNRFPRRTGKLKAVPEF